MEEQNTFMDDEWASLLLDSSAVPLADIDISAFANLSSDMLDPFRDDTTIPQDEAGAAVDVELGNRPFSEPFPLNTTDSLFCDEGGDIRTAGGSMLVVDTPPSGRSSPEPLASVNDHGLPYLVQGGSHGADGSSDGDCASGDCRSGDSGSGGCKEGSSQIGSPWHQSSVMSADPYAAAAAAAAAAVAPSCAATPPSTTGGLLSNGGVYAGIFSPSQFPESTVKQETGFCQQQQHVGGPFAMQSVPIQGVLFPGSVSSCFQQQQQQQQQQYRLQKQQQRRQQRQQKQLQKQQQQQQQQQQQKQQQQQQGNTAWVGGELVGCHPTPCSNPILPLPTTTPASFQNFTPQDAATCTVANGGLFPGNASSGAENAQKECESGGVEARGSVAGGGSGAAVAAEDECSEPSEGDEGGEGGEGEGEGEGEGRDPETEKREARLIRNRESAQLSRQRKKYYMDELEAQIRTMSAAVAELNSAVAHLTAENAPALALAMFGFLLILCPFLPPNGELTRGVAPAYSGWQDSVMSWQGSGTGSWEQMGGAWRDGWRWWGGGARRSEGRGGVAQGGEWGGGLGGGGVLRPGGRVLLGLGEEEEGGQGGGHAVGGDGLGVWWRGRGNGSMSGSVAQQQQGRALHASSLHSSSLDASALNLVWSDRVVAGARVEQHAADRQQQRFPAFAAVSVPNLTAGRAAAGRVREGRDATDRATAGVAFAADSRAAHSGAAAGGDSSPRARNSVSSSSSSSGGGGVGGAAGKAIVPWRQWSPAGTLRSRSAWAGISGSGGSAGHSGSGSGSGNGGSAGGLVSGRGSGGSASAGLRAGVSAGDRVAGALPGAAAVESSLPWDQQHWQQWLLQHSSGPLFHSHTCTELFRFDSHPTQGAQQGEAQDEAEASAARPAGSSSGSSSRNLSSSSSRVSGEASKESFPPVPVPVLSRRMFLRRRYLNELPASKQAIPLPDSNQPIPLLPPTHDTASSGSNPDGFVSEGGRRSGASSGASSTTSVDVSSSLEHNASAEGGPIRSVPVAVPGQQQQSGFRQQGAFAQPEPVVVSILSGFDAGSMESFFQSGTRGFSAGFAGADGAGGSERVNAGPMGKGGAEEEEVRGGMGGSVVVMVTSGGKSVAYACALGGSKGRSKVGGLVQARSS
ncbi:unnamed protein product [Closterium sp. Naga37s-1]|nr:unnamed protein product [Closterium sp. Naga37s-1]